MVAVCFPSHFPPFPVIPPPTYDALLLLLPDKVAKEAGVKKMVIACIMSAEQAECLPLFDTVYSGVCTFSLPAIIKFQLIPSFVVMTSRNST